MKSEDFKIYVLTDDSGVRYVGLTKVKLERRLAQHLREKIKSRKVNWINAHKSEVKIKLIKSGLSKEEACELEIFHISHFKYLGRDLVNGTIGGEFGCYTEEVRKRISDAMKGNTNNRNRIYKSLTAEQKEKLSKANLGKKTSQEVKNKISLKLKNNKNSVGRKFPKEHRDKISAANKGKPKPPRSEEHRTNSSKSRLGKKRGPYKRKMITDRPDDE